MSKGTGAVRPAASTNTALFGPVADKTWGGTVFIENMGEVVARCQMGVAPTNLASMTDNHWIFDEALGIGGSASIRGVAVGPGQTLVVRATTASVNFAYSRTEM